MTYCTLVGARCTTCPPWRIHTYHCVNDKVDLLSYTVSLCLDWQHDDVFAPVSSRGRRKLKSPHAGRAAADEKLSPRPIIMIPQRSAPAWLPASPQLMQSCRINKASTCVRLTRTAKHVRVSGCTTCVCLAMDVVSTWWSLQRLHYSSNVQSCRALALPCADCGLSLPMRHVMLCTAHACTCHRGSPRASTCTSDSPA